MDEVVEDSMVEGLDVFDDENDRQLGSAWTEIKHLFHTEESLFLEDVPELSLV